MKKLLAFIYILLAGVAFGQQPQTQTAPLFQTNSQWTNGVAPGYWPTPGTGLTLHVSSGTANCGSGNLDTYAGGTLTMTASTTNYVYLNTAAQCSPAAKTSAFSGSDIPIAVVVTSGTAITNVTDDRTMFNLGGGGSGGGSSLLSLFNAGYHFGDSLTFGYASTGGPQSSWTYYLDTALGITNGGTYINRGEPGWVSGQEDSLVYTQPVPYANTTLLTYMIGTNDLAYGGSNTNLAASYQLNIEAQAAYLVLPPSSRIPFNGTGVTFTGSWAAGGIIGQATETNGATATFTGTGSILYIATDALNSNTATASLSCDGSSVSATFNFTGVAGVALDHNESMLTRVTGLSNTNHTCTITNTTATGAGVVSFEWAGFTTGAAVSSGPLFLFEQIPDEEPANTNAGLYTAAQQAVVTLLNGDGFQQIHYVNNAGAVTSTNYNDSLHFNNYGYFQFAAPSIAAINNILNTNYAAFQVPEYFNAAQVDWCPAGQNSNCTGYGSAQNMTAGAARNDLYGVFAGHDLTTGADDVFMGSSTGSACTSCQSNTAIGSTSFTSGNGLGNTTVGYSSMYRDQGSGNTVMGWDADSGTSQFGGQKVIIGESAGRFAEGSLNVLIGAGSGVSLNGNIASMAISQTQMTSGVATYTFALQSGTAPIAGQLVSTSTLGNGGGIFIITQQPIASVTGNTFTVGGFPDESFSAVTEFGGATTTTVTTLTITSSALANTGLATYGYTVTSGVPPVPGELVTITGTSTAGREVPLNTSQTPINSSTGGSTGTITVGGFFVGISESEVSESSASGSLIVANNIFDDSGITLVGTNTGKSSSGTLLDATAIGYGATVNQSHTVQLGSLQVTAGFVGASSICLSNNTGCIQQPETTLTYGTNVAFNPSFLINTIILTGNVTSYSSGGAITSGGTSLEGQTMTVNICQDGAGGHTFDNSAGTGGTGFRGFFGTGSAPAISGTANSCSLQTFHFSLALESWLGDYPNVGQ